MRRRFRLELGGLREAGLVRPLLPIAAFELGNMATTLLILRATTLLHGHGRSVAAATSLAVLIYAGHNLIAAVVAYAGGHWIDRAGPRLGFAAGALVYVGSYLLFALGSGGWPVLLIAFLLAGTGIGLAETAESSLVARLLPDRLRGSGFGLLGGVQSLGDFASSAVVGLLWSAVSPLAGFLYAAAWMAVAAIATASHLGHGRPMTRRELAIPARRSARTASTFRPSRRRSSTTRATRSSASAATRGSAWSCSDPRSSTSSRADPCPLFVRRVAARPDTARPSISDLG